MVSQKRLKEVLDYNTKTGYFHWIAKPDRNAGQVIIGKRAGCFSKSTGYRNIQIDGIRKQEHVWAYLFMTGEMPKQQMDHINRVKNDNRWNNLRVVTNAQNSTNCIKPLGVHGRGVSKIKNRFIASIDHENKKYYLGTFGCATSAKLAYYKMAVKLRGTFAEPYHGHNSI